MNFEKDDCLIDSLLNINRVFIVCLLNVCVKFVNGVGKNFLF